MIFASDEIGELAKALSEAQGEFPVIPKSHVGKITGEGKNGRYEYSYHYADLADCVAAVQPILTAHSLSVAQFPGYADGFDTLETRVMHESGQWIEGSMRLFLAKEDPQAHGSAITYAKRYALCAALGIVADEDDDGAAATHVAEPLQAKIERVATVQREAPQRPPQRVNPAAAVPGARVYLTVPFKEKDEAKAAGARWDGKAPQPNSDKLGRWYMPAEADPFPLLKWLDEVPEPSEPEYADEPF